MSFCSRCLGANFGHILAATNYFVYQMLPLWVALIGLSIMFIDWYSQNKLKLYHNNIIRLITGIFGGYSVGLIIWFFVSIVVQFIKQKI